MPNDPVIATYARHDSGKRDLGPTPTNKRALVWFEYDQNKTEGKRTSRGWNRERDRVLVVRETRYMVKSRKRPRVPSTRSAEIGGCYLNVTEIYDNAGLLVSSVLLIRQTRYIPLCPEWLNTNTKGISRVQYSIHKVKQSPNYTTKRIIQLSEYFGRLTRGLELTNKPVLDCTA